jgi:hypothetical protein
MSPGLAKPFDFARFAAMTISTLCLGLMSLVGKLHIFFHFDDISAKGCPGKRNYGKQSNYGFH